MLRPAIQYKAELEEKFNSMFYTDELFYYRGCVPDFAFVVADSSENGCYEYAVLNDDGDLIGYIGYRIDFYTDAVYNFGLMSFETDSMKGIMIAKELKNLMEKLISEHHLVQWRMIGGNHVKKTYERFCKKHGGTVTYIPDIVRDRHGKWHGEYTYTILNGERRADD